MISCVGDKIEVRKQSHMSYYYRGVVERVLYNRFILKFRKDFIEDFRMGDSYYAEFSHNRVVFQRKHAAVDYAKQKLSESFLFPKKLTLANSLQLKADIHDEKLMLDGQETQWFKDLNGEQKEAVAGALRGECRPYPFIIFGPPVCSIQPVDFFSLNCVHKPVKSQCSDTNSFIEESILSEHLSK